MCFIIAAISCNKDVLGTLRGCVLLFERKILQKWICAIACISVCLNIMYYNEHSLSNQQRERKVKECIGFERWFLMQVTRVFIGPLMNVAMSTKAFANGVILITVVLHIANQIQEVFERSDFQTSLAFLEYRRFEARRAVVCSLSAYKEPKLPGTSSTGRTLYAFYSRCKISASEARVCAERKISIFWVKKSWHFYLSLSLLPSFFFILV